MTSSDSNVASQLIDAAKQLSDEVDAMTFSEPVTHVYNPLDYAWEAHQAYLSLVGDRGSSVIFLGMNPGPWGMAQTGVPFGEIAAARDFLGINVPVRRPENEHPKRPVTGFECPRSEVSGRRLWGLFQEKYKTSKKFFAKHFISNYCPLVFMEESARNRTPDKLPAEERELLSEACDRHLQTILGILNPKHVVGVGVYAEKCLQRALDQTGHKAKLSRILHPSPASPAANKDWSGKVTKQLTEAGIWRAK